MTEVDRDRPMERNTRVMLMGLGLGALCGLISAFLYTRAAEEHDKSDSSARESISTGQILAILLAILGVIRQVAELGKPKKPGKK